MKWKVAFSAVAMLVAGAAQARDTAKSPDALYTVSVVPYGEGDENGSGAQALVFYSTKGNVQRRLLVSKWNGDYSRNLAGISRPLFSLDGGYVYFNRGGSVYLNSSARLLSGASAGFMPLREAAG